jgi:hypothetical protein
VDDALLQPAAVTKSVKQSPNVKTSFFIAKSFLFNACL